MLEPCVISRSKIRVALCCVDAASAVHLRRVVDIMVLGALTDALHAAASDRPGCHGYPESDLNP